MKRGLPDRTVRLDQRVAWARTFFFAFLVSALSGFNLPAWPDASRSSGSQIPLGVISLDYCADQYVLALADDDQVMGLSRGADKGYSFFAERARGKPRLYGTIDEVLYLEPDVVVQTWGLSPRMLDLAGQRGIIAIEAEYGNDPDTVFGNVMRIGASFGQEERAAKLVADYRTRLHRLKDLPRLGLRAAYVTPSGVTSGTNTFVDEIIKLAGFESWAASRKLIGWQLLPLEDLILDPPDLFIASFFDTSLPTQSNWSIARHGRLFQMMTERPTVDLPGRYLACNGLFLIDAGERIRSEAERLLQTQTTRERKIEGALQ